MIYITEVTIIPEDNLDKKGRIKRTKLLNETCNLTHGLTSNYSVAFLPY